MRCTHDCNNNIPEYLIARNLYSPHKDTVLDYYEKRLLVQRRVIFITDTLVTQVEEIKRSQISEGNYVGSCLQVQY